MARLVGTCACHQVAPNAACDSRSGCQNRVPGEMGVARGRLNLGVAQGLTDHRQAFAERQRTGREGMPKAMGWPATGPYIEHRGSSNVSTRYW